MKQRRNEFACLSLLAAGLFMASHGSNSAAEPPGTERIVLDLEERGDVLVAGTTLRRTLVIAGIGPGARDLEVRWEARAGERVVASGGQGGVAAERGSARCALSIPLPGVSRPTGLDLLVLARAGDRRIGKASFPFTLYPEARGNTVADRLTRSRIALYDPEGRAGPVLSSLGLVVREYSEFEGLRDYEGDLIVIGPGGFTRGREALGPILAGRARGGMPVLLLEQATLPGTLTDGLRLWPSFSRTTETNVMFAPDHPVLRGLETPQVADYLNAAIAGARPLLPPTRGNVRVLAGLRVRSRGRSQDGVGLAEFPLGEGTVLAAQASLCADYHTDPRARILLVNALTYLLGERQPVGRAYLYAGGPEDLPRCLAQLAPRTTRAPPDLAGVRLLLVPGDWQAPRQHSGSGLPPLADVARYLHAGGTLLLLNPQALVTHYLARIVGEPVHFDPAPGLSSGTVSAAPSLSSSTALSAEDLRMLEVPGRAEFRLRDGAGSGDVEPLLLIAGLARYRVGRGTLVALALPDADACLAPRFSSLLARLLTDLGVPLDAEHGVAQGTLTRLSR
jgi:hypothetical protein